MVAHWAERWACLKAVVKVDQRARHWAALLAETTVARWVASKACTLAVSKAAHWAGQWDH